jgi:hypothetical protein
MKNAIEFFQIAFMHDIEVELESQSNLIDNQDILLNCQVKLK